jgi:beta-hydroxyacyl-ACP dehydratase FabZ
MDYPYDIESIFKMLPHRYPFLMIDRVLAFTPDENIEALKNVTINEPYFQGHFPQKPVMPGVMIVEAMAQAGGLLVYASMPPETWGRKLSYFMGIDKVRFRQQVVPGDQLIFKVQILKKRARAIKVAGVAEVEGKIVAQAELMTSGV